ncbi:Farnesyl pyrophosphate synthetase [Physocladia obscura]|uniref:Farnesyl pyrophosphate synthetase n=1 Tax=Physocladia obscura TaxID=109957 RepID=A0AAD5TA57_9FUNG|nr:Farnesyl pyrophosphate synthetase [Physocladia obscura]
MTKSKAPKRSSTRQAKKANGSSTAQKKPKIESVTTGTAAEGYDEKTHFETTYHILAKEILDDMQTYRLPRNGIEWVKKMLDYTIPGGKMNRGLTVVSSLKSLKKRDLDDEELLHAEVLGWCVELLQAFFLISDDIMDSSVTRRGAPCWYRAEGVGMVAINDAFIVEAAIYRLIKKYFRGQSWYADLLDLMHEVTYQTELGQLMDLITAPEDNVDLNRFSLEKYKYIVEFKTAYYSFYLPVALSMLLDGISAESESYKQALNVLLPLGEYFQAQDDYLDCFGAPEVIGKIGTDIEDNKCSWLVNQALPLCNEAQRKLLDENYGQRKAENVAVVKKVYNELDLEGLYKRYEEESHDKIMGLIEKINEDELPRDMFVTFVKRVYKPPATNPFKAAQMMKEIQLLKQMYDIDVGNPANFPSISMLAQRILFALKVQNSEKLEDVARAFWKLYWRDEKDIESKKDLYEYLAPIVTSEAANRLINVDSQNDKIKKGLINVTNSLVKEHGAFGLPWFIVKRASDGAEMTFFGSDKFEAIAWFLGEKYEGPCPPGYKAINSKL